jgi:hypothetical protein
MQETVYFDGGRPLYDDDLKTIQAEAQTAATAVLAGLGYDCIVTGCAAGGTTIGAGLVYISGQLLRFLGASSVTFPCSLVASNVAVVQDDRDYEDGINHPAIQEVFAVVQPGVASGVPVHARGGLTLQHVLRGAQWEVGDRKFGHIVVADYDATTGVGVPGSPAWGWGVDPLLIGRVAVGQDVNNPAFAAIGQQGGEEKHTLTIPEMPAHSHTTNANQRTATIQYDRGSTGGSPQPGSATVDSTGGSQGHNNLQPYTVLAGKIWLGF